MGSLPSVHALLHSVVRAATPLQRFPDVAVGKPIAWAWPSSVSGTALSGVEKELMSQIASPSPLRDFGTVLSRESGKGAFVSRIGSYRVFPFVIGALVCGVALVVAYQFFAERHSPQFYDDPFNPSKETTVRDPLLSSLFPLVFPAFEISHLINPSHESNAFNDLNEEKYLFPAESPQVNPIYEVPAPLPQKIYFSGLIKTPLSDQETAPIRIIKDLKMGVEIRILRENGKDILIVEGGIVLADAVRKYLSELVVPNHAEHLLEEARHESELLRESHRFAPTVEQIPEIVTHQYRDLVAQGNIAHFGIYLGNLAEQIARNLPPDQIRYGIFYPARTALREASFHLYIPFLEGEEGREVFAFVNIVRMMMTEELIKAGILSSVEPQHPFSQISQTEFAWRGLISGHLIPLSQILPTVESSLLEIYGKAMMNERIQKITLDRVLRISFIRHPQSQAEAMTASAFLRSLIIRGRLTVVKPVR